MESKTYKVSNGETKMQLYTPWGERRYPTAASEISSRYRYIGQYEYSELGLYFYQSRWYDATLGRFAQADTEVPESQDGKGFDRYAYAVNNPTKYVDPDGHNPIIWPLIGIFVYILTLPGDSGPYEIDPMTAVIGDAGIRMIDPVDMVYTAADCCQGQCSITDVVLSVIPFANGGMDNLAHAAKDIVKTSGQLHHVLSAKIMRALDQHPTLNKIFNRKDLIVKAIDGAAHRGYQLWHREYDTIVVNWLNDPNNQNASPEEFLEFLKSLYNEKWLLEKFPNSVQVLENAIEGTRGMYKSNKR